MKNDKNDRPHIYPSDYIDYTPQGRSYSFLSLRRNRILILVIACFTILSISFAKSLVSENSLDPKEFSIAVQAIVEDTGKIIDELNHVSSQLKQQAEDRDFKFEQSVKNKLFSVQSNLDTASNELQDIQRDLSKEAEYLENLLAPEP